MTRWHAALLVLACAYGCHASPTHQAPPPDHGFAKPPPNGSSSPPAPTVLPATGPECARQDCPTTAPMFPTEQCADGIHIGGRGPCVRFSNGTCNWSGLVCPTASTVTCSAADCDLPVPAEWTCPDGKSTGAFTCVPTKQGTCGATYRACPASPAVVTTPPTPPPPPPHACDPLPNDRELATWKVESMCFPSQGPDPPPQKLIKTLADGTKIIEVMGRCMRVQHRTCNTKCLPPDARIATPSGDVPVRDVRVGAAIWTRDATGRRVVGRVERVSSIAVTTEHFVARVVLADGRAFTASPEHPVLGGRVVQQLLVGETYDGSVVVARELVRYTEARTYDLLPSGATGVYWSDGVPLRSTLELP